MTQADRYIKLAALTKGMDTIDSSYHAAFYLLSHDPELWETASRYVTVDGIGFTGLKQTTCDFDEHTRQVVDIAHSLFSWSGKCSVTPFDISRLGYPYMELVCNAFYIAAGQVKVVLTQEQDGKEKWLWMIPIIRIPSVFTGSLSGFKTPWLGIWYRTRPQSRKGKI